MKTLTLSFLLTLVLNSVPTFATEFKFIGFVKSKDVEIELEDFRRWTSPPSSHWEMNIKVKGKVIHTYRVGENSSHVFGENGSFIRELAKYKKRVNQEVLLILPESLTRDDMTRPYIYERPNKKKGYLKKRGGMIAIINPSIHSLNFSDAGPIYNKEGAVDIKLNGLKILNLDGMGFKAPRSTGLDKGSMEMIYNDHLLSIDGEDDRILMATNSRGFFRIIHFTPQTLD